MRRNNDLARKIVTIGTGNWAILAARFPRLHEDVEWITAAIRGYGVAGATGLLDLPDDDLQALKAAYVMGGEEGVAVLFDTYMEEVP